LFFFSAGGCMENCFFFVGLGRVGGVAAGFFVFVTE
jgi:hypothetical protein